MCEFVNEVKSSGTAYAQSGFLGAHGGPETDRHQSQFADAVAQSPPLHVGFSERHCRLEGLREVCEGGLAPFCVCRICVSEVLPWGENAEVGLASSWKGEIRCEGQRENIEKRKTVCRFLRLFEGRKPTGSQWHRPNVQPRFQIPLLFYPTPLFPRTSSKHVLEKY